MLITRPQREETAGSRASRRTRGVLLLAVFLLIGLLTPVVVPLRLTIGDKILRTGWFQVRPDGAPVVPQRVPMFLPVEHGFSETRIQGPGMFQRDYRLRIGNWVYQVTWALDQDFRFIQENGSVR